MARAGRLCAGAALALALTAPASADARDADDMLDDAATFRTALGESTSLNLELVVDGEQPASYQGRLGAVSLELQAGADVRAVRADDVDEAPELRVLAAFVGRASPGEAIAALGLPEELDFVTVDVFDDADTGPVFVHVIGGPRAEWAFEVGTGRPRRLVVRWSERLYTVDALRFDGSLSAWFPTVVVVRRDGDEVVRMTLTDIAPNQASLAPLVAPTPPVDDSWPWPAMPL